MAGIGLVAVLELALGVVDVAVGVAGLGVGFVILFQASVAGEKAQTSLPQVVGVSAAEDEELVVGRVIDAARVGQDAGRGRGETGHLLPGVLGDGRQLWVRPWLRGLGFSICSPAYSIAAVKSIMAITTA